MFKVQDNGNSYVPSKSISLKPDVVSDVVGEDQIKINVPSYIGFVDPNQSYLKFNLTINNARGNLVPDKDAGGHALFRNIEVRDGANKSQIEFAEDYNCNYALLSNYTKQNTIAHKRELFNGMVNKLADKIYDPNLYYASPSAHGGTVTAPTGLSKTALNPKIVLPLNLGLFKQGQVLPVGLMNGLRMTLDTEDPLRALMYLNDETRSSEDAGDLTLASNRVLCFDTGGAGNVKAIGDDARGNNANLSDTIFSIQLRMTDRNTCPFDVNDIVYIANADDGTNEEKLGTIVGFHTNTNRVSLSYVPDRNRAVGLAANHAENNSMVYVKIADRQSSHTVCGSADVGADTKSLVINAPTYTMSDIELVVMQLSPPSNYVNSALKAVQGEKGIQMDIMAYELYRHNQNNIQGLQQMQIPTKMRRAKSLFSQPLSVNRFRDLGNSSFQGLADQARTYEWIYGTKHYPSRLAPLNRYSLVIGNRNRFRTEALHSSELQKAILNVNEKVLSLQRIPDHFTIARALTKYGQVMDVSEQTLSLRVDYNTNAAINKIFNNYVYGLRRIVINKDGVQAFN